eukprot:7635044-Pyramimonas_sp.AAC.2
MLGAPYKPEMGDVVGPSESAAQAINRARASCQTMYFEVVRRVLLCAYDDGRLQNNAYDL